MKTKSQTEFNQIVWQFMKFCMVSLPGVGLAFGILNLCMFFWGNFAAANVMAFVIVATWNFFLHRVFTFGGAGGSVVGQWFKYVTASLGVTAGSWVISMGLYYNFAYFERHFNYAALMGVGVTSVAFFFYSRSYIFRK